MNIENKYKVRLIPVASLLGGEVTDVRNSQVVFEVTPTFSESGTVDYSAITPVHMPGSIQIYKHTNSRTFEIGAKLISRNLEDAKQNMVYLQRLRGWRYPYFGQTSTLTGAQQDSRRMKGRTYQGEEPLSATDRENLVRKRIREEGVQLRGAPPDVLYLYAYSTGANDSRPITPARVNINRVPVVITSLNITYPDDVTYIPVYASQRPGAQAEPFPVKMDVTISLAETHSPGEFESFDLQKFKTGNLVSF